MKKYVLIGLLAGSTALVGCGTTPAPAPQPPVVKNAATPSQSSAPPPTTSQSTTPKTPVSGNDVFDKNCAGCHGPAGAGATAPALNTEARTQAEVVDITKKGKGTMPGYAKVLSDNEIQAVAQYVAGLKK